MIFELLDLAYFFESALDPLILFGPIYVVISVVSLLCSGLCDDA